MSTPHAGSPADAPARTSTAAGAPAPEPAPALESTATGGRPHLVVVTSRAATPDDAAPAEAVLVTRFWHPRDRAWSENFFESLEHALRLFVHESDWTLLQHQALAGAHAHELIFEAHRIDFSRPSTEQILRDIGMAPGRVADILDQPPPT